jgi:hypothetical protein
MSVAKNIMPTFSVLVSNNHYYHPADGVFVTNTVLSHAICPSFFAEVAKEIERDRECVLIKLSLAQRSAPGLGCCHEI